MAVKTEDELAIERTLQGDKEAFLDLVRRHRIAVMRLCHFTCGDYDTAAVLVKRAFLSFANSMADYRNKGDMHDLLIDHAAKELKAWIKRGAQLASQGGGYEEKLKEAFFFPAEEMARLGKRSLDEVVNYTVKVARMMRRVPPDVKLTAGLKIFEKRSYINIAAVLGIEKREVEAAMEKFRKAVLGSG
jgi:DNA-directed RNA polymerase specialized sigma24 family protein